MPQLLFLVILFLFLYYLILFIYINSYLCLFNSLFIYCYFWACTHTIIAGFRLCHHIIKSTYKINKNKNISTYKRCLPVANSDWRPLQDGHWVEYGNQSGSSLAVAVGVPLLPPRRQERLGHRREGPAVRLANQRHSRRFHGRDVAPILLGMISEEMLGFKEENWYKI